MAVLPLSDERQSAVMSRWLVLHLFLFLSYVCSNAAADQEISVLSISPTSVIWKLYQINNLHLTKLIREAELREFMRDHKVREGTYQERYDIQLERAVLSPDHAYLACNYSADTGAVIRVYELATGKKIRDIRADHQEAKKLQQSSIDWCGWRTGNLLRFTESYDTEGHSPYHLDIKEYDIETGQIQMVKSHQGEDALDYDPEEYANRARKAAAVFQRLHLRGPASHESPGAFDWTILGIYSSTSQGAVSEDGQYAIALTSNLSGTRSINYYVLVADGKKVAEMDWHKDPPIRRLKFVPGFLLINTKQGKKGTVLIRNLKPWKQVGSLEGDFLVD